MGFGPELAHIRLGLAELLLHHHRGKRAAASEHQDFAIAELRDIKLQLALGHRGLLKAESARHCHGPSRHWEL